MKLVMTLLVRDEEDIIVANREHHLNDGVDFAYITDNLSRDKTRDLVAPYEKAGVAEVIPECSDDYSQSVWVTRMARRACVDGADWVINGDADEFWWPTEHAAIRSFFRGLEPGLGVVVASRSDFVPIEPASTSQFWERMIYKKTVSLNTMGRRLPPKVAHRASRDVEIAQGNHSVTGLDEMLQEQRNGLEILHFPMRSEAQFTRKIINGGSAYTRNTHLEPEIGATWRRLYFEYLSRGIEEHYRSAVVNQDDVGRLLDDGVIVRDTRLRDRMRLLLGAGQRFDSRN